MHSTDWLVHGLHFTGRGHSKMYVLGFLLFRTLWFLTRFKVGRPSVGVLWFAIFSQLFLILGVLYTLASDSIAMNRLQISIFGAITVVFAVIGVDAGLFSGDPSRSAMSAGWLILAIVDIIWLLYFTSEEDSLILYIFNSYGTGGLTPPSRRRRATRSQSVHNMTSNNGYATNYASGGGIGSNDVSYDLKIGGPIGNVGVGSGGQALRSQQSLGRASPVQSANRSLGEPAGGGSTPMAGNTSLEPNSPLIGSGQAGLGAGGGSPNASAVNAAPSPDTYIYKAKALYTCEYILPLFCARLDFFSDSASPDDPSEISFTKGEILDIVDKQGKWWQARKADGALGSAYCLFIFLPLER